MAQLLVSDFIESLQPLVSELGPGTVQTIVRHFGGTRLYVPRVWREGLDLNIIGEADAQKLCRLFGPERLEIPKAAFSAEGIRRLASAMRAAGMQNSAIARQLGVHYRTVTERLAGTPVLTGRGRRVADSRQIDLEEWLKSGTR